MALTPAEIQANYRARQRLLKPQTQTFTYKGKTYTVPTRLSKKTIEQLKEFLKSLDEWKAGGSNFHHLILLLLISLLEQGQSLLTLR